MPTTSNFGWTTPADTDLVKNGALAIRTLGNGIDTSMAELKGGTTGQVLSKTSNTDMDFTWVTTDDANAIQNAIVDAKGDLIAATANDTPARLAVGNNGETLVADSSATTGLRYQNNFAAGKNKFLNADFNIWQRGTSFNIPAYTVDVYACDRWQGYAGSGTATMSRQAFTAGAAPVAGYESQYFFRYNQTVSAANVGTPVIYTKIEDVRTLAGQTATISFWAKAGASATISGQFDQNFGSGGSATVSTSTGSFSVTTSWARYSATVSIPSISGKTIGSSSYLAFTFIMPTSGTYTIDYWGVQLEAGNVATAFQTATGTLAGELAAAMRYYQRFSGTGSNPGAAGYGYSQNTGAVVLSIPPMVPMRTTPSSLDYSGLLLQDNLNNTIGSFTSVTLETNVASPYCFAVTFAKSAAYTAGRTYRLIGNSSSDYIGFSAEL